jgi:uncharacterized protein DUF5684
MSKTSNIIGEAMHLLSLLGHAGHNHLASNSLEPSTLSNEQASIIVLTVFAVMFLAVLLVYVITSLCLSSIFKKAGVESWKAWVPVYNTWTLLELGGQKGYWAVLAFIPFVGIVSAIFVIIAMYYIGRKLGKSDTFVLLAIFLPLVWYIWLAVDKSKWQDKTATKPAPKKAA